MPTAVERLLDSFLKFDNAREQLKLDDAFLKIDEAFQKLANVNGDGFNFLKIEHDLKLAQTFNVVGQAFDKVGDDFHKVETADRLIADFTVKLLGDHKVSSDVLGAIKIDFAVLDHKISAISTDLKILGGDFLKLDSSPNQRVFDHKVETLGTDMRKAGGDASAAGQAFLNLGQDFLKLQSSREGDQSPLDLAYKEFGGDLIDIGRTFGTLADSFLKLDDALHGTGGGGGAGDGANTIGGALQLIYQQFHALDIKFAALGDGSVRLIDELLPAVQHDHGTNSHGGGGGSG